MRVDEVDHIGQRDAQIPHSAVDDLADGFIAFFLRTEYLFQRQFLGLFADLRQHGTLSGFQRFPAVGQDGTDAGQGFQRARHTQSRHIAAAGVGGQPGIHDHPADLTGGGVLPPEGMIVQHQRAGNAPIDIAEGEGGVIAQQFRVEERHRAGTAAGVVLEPDRKPDLLADPAGQRLFPPLLPFVVAGILDDAVVGVHDAGQGDTHPQQPLPQVGIPLLDGVQQIQQLLHHGLVFLGHQVGRALCQHLAPQVGDAVMGGVAPQRNAQRQVCPRHKVNVDGLAAGSPPLALGLFQFLHDPLLDQLAHDVGDGRRGQLQLVCDLRPGKRCRAIQDRFDVLHVLLFDFGKVFPL